MISVTDSQFSRGGIGLAQNAVNPGTSSVYESLSVYYAQPGVELEEGTTNLLAANQSHPTDGTAGLAIAGADLYDGALSQVSSPSWATGGSGQAAVAYAELDEPTGVAVDSAGNIYIADFAHCCIRKVNTSGIMFTVAGNGTAGFSGGGVAATAAELKYPEDVAVDSAGNIYIADTSNNCIREVNTSGIISTVAGDGNYASYGDGGPATSAALAYPVGVAVDSSGNMYIADYGGNRIRKVNTSGIISTVAGDGTAGFSGDGGAATSAELNHPIGVAVDSAGNLYIADAHNNRIREVDTSGIISTVAGDGTAGFSGDGGVATGAELNDPTRVAVDFAGNIYITDRYNKRIRKVDKNGVISTVAGDGVAGYTGDGGAATAAELGLPYAVAVDSAGNIYIADVDTSRIRKVDAAGIISTVAGNGTRSGDGGAATDAELNDPWGVAVDSAGNIYIADTSNNCIREVNTSGIISTVAGDGIYGFSGDGGAATGAELNGPAGVAVDSAGNIYVADTYNNCIREVSTGGIISTVAGDGVAGYSGDGGAATAAELNYPDGVAVDSAGNIYLADYYNNRIRRVSASGVISTVAGNGTAGFSGDGGTATAAELAYPDGVAVDSAGNIYIADSVNMRIREVSASGIISTVAGDGTYGLSGDGWPATGAELTYPTAVAVDSSGNIDIADYLNNRVRQVSTGGIISTVAGIGGFTQNPNDPDVNLATVDPSSGNEATAVAVAPSTPYSFSARVLAPAGVPYRLRAVQWNASGSIVADTAFAATTGEGVWQTVYGSLTTTASTVYMSLRVRFGGIGTFNVDGLQVEQKACPTSWITGGSSRAPESLTIPTAHVFTRGDWTIEMQYRPNVIDAVYPHDLACYRIDADNFMELGVDPGGYLALHIKSAGTGYGIVSTTPLVAGQSYSIMAAGDGQHIRLCCNGSQIGSDTAYVEPQGTLPTTLGIGCDPGGDDAQADGTIADLRISNRARTLADHQAAYASGLPLPVDGSTICKMDGDNTLQFSQPPQVTGLSPASGPAAGGTDVTVTGSGFTGATAVYFGSTPATDLSVYSDTQLTALSPPGAGTVDVTVYGPGWSTAVSGNDRFSYTPPWPVVTGISPASGPAFGGTVVTVTGSGFTGATAVYFGNTPGTGVSVNSGTSLIVTSPPGANTVDVVVYGPSGTSATNANDQFTYTAVPSTLVTSYSYDTFNDPTSVVDPAGHTTSMAYDAEGNLLTVTKQVYGGTSTTTFTYNKYGQVASTTDPDGHTISYTYDQYGNLASVTDALGNITAYAYDPAGRMLTKTDAMGHTMQYTYDAAGNLLTETDPLGRTTTYTYDADGNKATVTDPRGNTTRYAYDADNNLVSETDPLGDTITYGYDADNNRVSVTDAVYHTTTYTYDGLNRLVGVTDPDGETQTYALDGNGNRTGVTDRDGNTTGYTYDALGRLTAVTDALGSQVTTHYDALGNPTTVTDQRGYTTDYTYGPGSRLLAVTDPLGHTTSYTYDPAGNRISVTNPLGETWTYAYDGNNRQITATDPLGHVTNTDYDSVGNVVYSTDSDGNSTRFGYNDDNELSSVTDGLGNTTEYGYDADGNLAQVTNARGYTGTLSYDALDRLVSKTDPMGHVTKTSYDGVGNLISKTWPNGTTINYSYDPDSRLASITYPDQGGVTFAYDPDGNRTSMTDPSGTTTYKYNSLAELTSVVRDVYSVGYTYDQAGNIAGITYPGGLQVNYSYNALNQPVSVSDGVYGATISYDPAGQRIGEVLPNGIQVTYGYDQGGRLTVVEGVYGGSVLTKSAYTLDNVGNRLSVTDENGGTTNYSYNNDYELLHVTYSNGQTGTYTYDAAGNRTSENGVPYTYDKDNHLTMVGNAPYTYDANGNMLSDNNARYTYDDENRLTQVALDSGQNILYTYNGDGNRVSESVYGNVYGQSSNQVYVYDVNAAVPRLLAVADGTGNINDYLYDGRLYEGILGSVAGNVYNVPGGRIFYQQDGLGSTSVITNVYGQLLNRYSYDAFGQPDVLEDMVPNPFLYTGEPYDQADELLYLRARYYDPQIGRFLSQDNFFGKLTDPLSENGYAYAESNPVVYVDPTGHCSEAGWLSNSYGGFVSWLKELFYPKPSSVSTPFVRELPPLKTVNPKAAESFDEGRIGTETLKPGEWYYRAEPFGTTDLTSRWLGTKMPSSQEEADQLYNIQIYGNPMEQVGVYTPAQPVTVYVGGVKGGTGEQIYIPDDVPKNVFEQVGFEPLLPGLSGSSDESSGGDDIEIPDME